MTDADKIIEEFQRRKAVFQPLWNRNMLTVFFPGFLIFGLGVWTGQKWIAIGGFAVCVVGLARGFGLAYKHHRCPACEHMVSPGKGYPNDWCRHCGVDLSR